MGTGNSEHKAFAEEGKEKGEQEREKVKWGLGNQALFVKNLKNYFSERKEKEMKEKWIERQAIKATALQCGVSQRKVREVIEGANKRRSLNTAEWLYHCNELPSRAHYLPLADSEEEQEILNTFYAYFQQFMDWYADAD